MPYVTGTDDHLWSGPAPDVLNNGSLTASVLGYSSTSACNVDGRGHCYTNSHSQIKSKSGDQNDTFDDTPYVTDTDS